VAIETLTISLAAIWLDGSINTVSCNKKTNLNNNVMSVELKMAHFRVDYHDRRTGNG
jgi:hypothetical protein